jgi:cell division protein FtsI (penicillin-binding protein 3)
MLRAGIVPGFLGPGGGGRRRPPLRPAQRPANPRASVTLKSAPPPAAALLSRHYWMLALMALGFAVLLARALDLHVLHRDFLQSQGEARQLRNVTLPAHRGMFLDRHAEPIAISTPVQSIWINPRQFVEQRALWPQVARALDLREADLAALLKGREQREFLYLKRHVGPEQAARATEVPGVFAQREYRRFYPASEATAHVLGFTDIDDVGQEGLELAFEQKLKGIPGGKRVMQDNQGRTIAEVAHLQDPQPGQDIRLSLDRRLQSLAYRELERAVKEHRAKGGSLVILDVSSGEILAMVNQPGYNPNDREQRDSRRYRNRAVTDVFEPGSTIKPFTVAAVLENGKYRANSWIDTKPGSLKLGKYTIRDAHNYGSLDLRGILQKSSNVGASKLALSLPAEDLWKMLSGVGLGRLPGSGFPGEVPGTLPAHASWRQTRQASLGFGYGLNTSLLSLAHAYTVLAGDGKLRPLRWTYAQAGENAEGTRVMSEATARQVREMLESVVSAKGTAPQAAVANYRVGGKTGTVRKALDGRYAYDRYTALFAGMAPLSSPRLVVAVAIDEPSSGGYYAGQVAAPVFSRVMGGALRLLDIPPDGK